MWNEWFGKHEGKSPSPSKSSNLEKGSEKETEAETIKNTDNDDLNNCEDIQDSICCCLCFREEVKKSSEFRELLEMFKILIIPQSHLLLLFKKLNNVNLKKAFRIAALFVHPDKN